MDRYQDLTKFAFGERWCVFLSHFSLSSFSTIRRNRIRNSNLSLLSPPFPSQPFPHQQGLLAPHPLPGHPLRRHPDRLHHHCRHFLPEDCRARRPRLELGRRGRRGRRRRAGPLDLYLHADQPLCGPDPLVPLAVGRVDDRHLGVGLLGARRVHRVAGPRHGRQKRGGVVPVRRREIGRFDRGAGLQRRERDRDHRFRVRR